MTTDNVKVSEWLEVIAAYDREFASWGKRADKIEKRYKGERGSRDKDSRFNVLWSNVQTVLPAVFARLPRPDVSRRFADTDPVGRVASLLLERALSYEIENHEDYRRAMHSSIKDRFLGGRGTAWVRYEPGFEDNDEDQDESPGTLDYECARVDYVHWRDFGHTVARTWEEVTAVWRIVYMDEDALEDRFGEEVAAKVPLDANPNEATRRAVNNDTKKQAAVYEIWDKSTKRAIWIAKGVATALDVQDDPMGLENFWPCPRPLFATLTNDSLIPVPDFAQYQDQASQLDVLSDRIDGLIKALQVKGVYDATFPELQRLFTEGTNGDLIAVKNYAALAEKSGLKGSVEMIDLTNIAMALEHCYRAVGEIKAQVYEITGISDILRGDTEASETATAQKIKDRYASGRLSNMRENVSHFAADLIRIKAQIIAGYEPQTILRISAADQLRDEDKQLVPQALALIKNKVLRNFRIDIESDSLVADDQQKEQEARTEFLQATGSFLQQANEVIQASPVVAPLVLEMLRFGVTGFKVGRSLEGVFDEVAEQVKQQIQRQQNQPPQDPEAAKAQAKAQADQAVEQARAQADMQIEQFRTQANQAIEQARMASDERMQAMQQQHEMAMEQMRKQSDANLQLILARLNNEAKVEVAEISAQTTLDAAQISAANQGSSDGA